MLSIFIVLCLGVALGWLTRHLRGSRRIATRATSIIILLMMMMLGIEVGGNKMLLNNLGSIGLTAILLGLGAVAGVLLTAWGLWRLSFRKIVLPKSAPERVIAARKATKNSASDNLFSILMVGIFILGITFGILTPVAGWMTGYPLTIWTLYLLMLVVGITIGGDTATLQNIARQPKRTLLVPLATILGTWIGVTIVWGGIRVLGGVPMLWSDAMAVGSGMGYYSLSGVLLGELRGAEVGTIALLANITRELLTITGAGWMARRFSPLSPICAGGATTADISLPVIIRHCGTEYVPLALFHGVMIDVSVPFLISFFAGIGV